MNTKISSQYNVGSQDALVTIGLGNMEKDASIGTILRRAGGAIKSGTGRLISSFAPKTGARLGASGRRTTIGAQRDRVAEKARNFQSFDGMSRKDALRKAKMRPGPTKSSPYSNPSGTGAGTTNVNQHPMVKNPNLGKNTPKPKGPLGGNTPKPGRRGPLGGNMRSAQQKAWGWAKKNPLLAAGGAYAGHRMLGSNQPTIIT